MSRNLLVSALLVMVFVVTVRSYAVLPEWMAWMNWKTQHGIRYPTLEEELARRNTWIKNKQIIDEHNRAYHEGRRSFKIGMNQFADQELGKFRNRLELKTKSSGRLSSSSSSIPSSWDWRKEGKVDDVENQGQRGSALPFNIADAVDSYSAIYDQTEMSKLAVQEVVDCCLPSPLVDPYVFDCIHDHGGLCLNGSYHTGSPPNICNNASCKAVASCNVGKAVTAGNESLLAGAVYSTPVVVAVDASQPSFQLYVSGVYSDPDCSSTRLDHSLLLVGYGVTSAGTQYWICRNTWGEEWGEKGYINIARNHNNMCGIASYAIYPSK